jgi:hypothetical protein
VAVVGTEMVIVVAQVAAVVDNLEQVQEVLEHQDKVMVGVLMAQDWLGVVAVELAE